MSSYLISDFKDVTDLAEQVYAKVLRGDFSQPGCALVQPADIDGSQDFRQLMHELKHQLAGIHEKKTGNSIGYFAISRFSQKNNTKPHRDAAPDRSFLMLGYEPTEVESEVTVCDITKCAFDMDISPNDFLSDFNPMYQKGMDKLQPYTIALSDFDISKYQILFVNNSVEQFLNNKTNWLGLLHSASIKDSDSEKSRVVNSTCLMELGPDDEETVSCKDIEEFLSTDKLKEYA